ncbi:succinate dehydrogenase [Xinfangfangia sp. CPCC 101601]|uniref:Succinate dehydrogenase n=1 Tax=Pseudogemmobacter lacusdianii TaxID=3069608 RepID=A0ABU0VWP7_9RHOB|nr:succinate dehydrogenase [Xinfangfangia sp. CPCC 101601]MDQ2066176.1 succinate dehydrogenase [Xinfangfangia sp. CPCC 101601]
MRAALKASGITALLALTLSGCVAGEVVMQETTRSLARSAVNAAAARYVPGVNVAPYTDCVINNATTAELIQLAQAAGAGATGGAAQDVAASAWPVVRSVASRPEATQCLVQTLSTSQILAGQGLALGGL